MGKYIDADRLKELLSNKYKEFTEKSKNFCFMQYQFMADGLTIAEQTVDSLQQEQPIKVYRVENEKEQKGLWRKFDGTWEPLFDMLTDGQCKDMPMEDSPIYREGGKQWFASAPSKETLQKWFSKRDLEELTAKGFTISEFEVVGHKKVSDFEYIFTRDNIISRTYLKVSDIYPQEQPDCHTVEDWIQHIQNADQLTKDIFSKGPYDVLYDALNHPYQHCYDAIKEFGELCFRTGVNSVKQEQPEVDLEEEIAIYLRTFSSSFENGIEYTKNIARHFYKLGLNARKEE